MPRYFFHLRDDLSADDAEGQELPNLETALVRAEAYVADLAAAAVKEQRKLNLNHHIEVAGRSWRRFAHRQFRACGEGGGMKRITSW